MDTQLLLEESKKINQKEITKELITDESMIVGGTVDTIEIIDIATIENTRRSNFLG